MKRLTRAEEEIMQVLWKIGKGFVNDILEEFPEPKPAYTTVSTVIRTLEKKGFVDYKAYGKTHEYFPVIEQKQYAGSMFRNLLSGYFENSPSSLASFMTREENLGIKDLEEIREILDNEIDKLKKEKP
jgi:BlaI family transcriptional regulator, penicillinase repressor